MRFPFLYVLRPQKKLDIAVQMIDAGGGDLCATLGLGQYTRINVHEDYELRYWSNKFGVTSSELRRAVGKVGVDADDVAREFGILKVQMVQVVSP